MKRYVLTGTPGAGKTTVLNVLRTRGWPVVDEAATDAITAQQAVGVAEPWTAPGFIDNILELQMARQSGSTVAGDVAFHDRSPFCTLALARHLGVPPISALLREVARLRETGFYQPTAFVIRPLGFVTPTAVRRISYRDSLAFEAVHEQVYLEYGFALVDVPRADPADRADVIERFVAAL